MGEMKRSLRQMEVVYDPGSRLRDPNKLVVEMLRDLRASRQLAWRLFVRNLTARYRLSVLGYFWAFLPALATTATFVFLNSEGVISVGETELPYVGYVLIGTVLWQCFTDAALSPISAVRDARSMLTKVWFPREALVLAGIGEVLFRFLVRMVLLVAVLCWYQIPVKASVLLFPIGVGGLLLIGLVIGLFFLPLGVLYDDVGRGLEMVLGFWFFVTPVIYPPPVDGIASCFVRLNPVAALLTAARGWVTGVEVSGVVGIVVIYVIGIALLMLAWLLYRLALPVLIERFGS